MIVLTIYHGLDANYMRWKTPLKEHKLKWRWLSCKQMYQKSKHIISKLLSEFLLERKNGAAPRPGAWDRKWDNDKLGVSSKP